MGLRVCPSILSVSLHVVVRSDDDAFFLDAVAASKHDAHRSVVVLEVGEDPRGQPPITSEPE